MYKIIAIEKYPVDKAISRISALDDPLVVDITPEKDEKLHGFLGRNNYFHVWELANKGKTVIIFRSKIKGTWRIGKLVERAQEFDRELVLLYNDSDHLSIVRSVLNGREGDSGGTAS